MWQKQTGLGGDETRAERGAEIAGTLRADGFGFRPLHVEDTEGKKIGRLSGR